MQKELNSSENSKFLFVYICIFLHSFVFIVVSAVLLQGKSNNKKQFIAYVGIFFYLHCSCTKYVMYNRYDTNII